MKTKMVKSIFLTLVCAAAILAVGYAGIIFVGEQVLKSPQEPELITMTGNISNLFYSELEDDIELYPWNYYPKDEDTSQQEGENGQQDGELDTSEKFFDYSPYVENNVFYTLISVAADVDVQEVSRWYNEQEKTIISSLKQGKTQDGEAVDWYFYKDVIRLNGKEYQVKIACNSWSVTSFSCIQCRAEGVKETEKWNTNKESFIKWMEENPSLLVEALYEMYDMHASMWQTEDWYMYVELYQNYRDTIRCSMVEEKTGERNGEKTGEKTGAEKNQAETVDGQVFNAEWAEKYGEVDGKEEIGKETATDVDLVENAIQVIELKDSLLMVMEEEIAIGLYYDVIEQRITGFHFFL